MTFLNCNNYLFWIDYGDERVFLGTNFQCMEPFIKVFCWRTWPRYHVNIIRIFLYQHCHEICKINLILSKKCEILKNVNFHEFLLILAPFCENFCMGTLFFVCVFSKRAPRQNKWKHFYEYPKLNLNGSVPP